MKIACQVVLAARIPDKPVYFSRILDKRWRRAQRQSPVFVPDDYIGDVLRDVGSRRGKVEGIEEQTPGLQVMRAAVPLAEMFGYATDLRSMTQGRAVYTMEFYHYAEVPAKVQEELLERTVLRV